MYGSVRPGWGRGNEEDRSWDTPIPMHRFSSRPIHIATLQVHPKHCDTTDIIVLVLVSFGGILCPFKFEQHIPFCLQCFIVSYTNMISWIIWNPQFRTVWYPWPAPKSALLRPVTSSVSIGPSSRVLTHLVSQHGGWGCGVLWGSIRLTCTLYPAEMMAWDALQKSDVPACCVLVRNGLANLAAKKSIHDYLCSLTEHQKYQFTRYDEQPPSQNFGTVKDPAILFVMIFLSENWLSQCTERTYQFPPRVALIYLLAWRNPDLSFQNLSNQSVYQIWDGWICDKPILLGIKYSNHI